MGTQSAGGKLSHPVVEAVTLCFLRIYDFKYYIYVFDPFEFIFMGVR